MNLWNTIAILQLHSLHEYSISSSLKNWSSAVWILGENRDFALCVKKMVQENEMNETLQMHAFL